MTAIYPAVKVLCIWKKPGLIGMIGIWVYPLIPLYLSRAWSTLTDIYQPYSPDHNHYYNIADGDNI